MRISDPSTLNLSALLLWHYSDSKPRNIITADKEQKINGIILFETSEASRQTGNCP